MPRLQTESVVEVEVEYEDDHLNGALRAHGISYEESLRLTQQERDRLRSAYKECAFAASYGSHGAMYANLSEVLNRGSIFQ